MTKKRSREELTSRLDRARIEHLFVTVRLSIDDAEDVSGFVVDLGTTWVLLAVLTDARALDGFAAVRLKHIAKVKVAKRGRDLERRILEARGQWPLEIPDVRLDRTAQMLVDLADLAPERVVAVHQERLSPGRFFLGRFVGIDAGEVELHDLGPDATWADDEHERYALRDLTGVHVGDAYTAGLLLVADPSPGSEK